MATYRDHNPVHYRPHNGNKASISYTGADSCCQLARDFMTGQVTCLSCPLAKCLLDMTRREREAFFREKQPV